MSMRTPLWLAAVALLALGSAARAGFVTDTLGAAGPGNFAIFSLGGTNVSDTQDTLNGPGQTTGNVGVASVGNIALNSSTPPAIIGNLYLGNSSGTAGSAGNLAAQVSGTILTNQDSFLGMGNSAGFWTGATTNATGAVADALNAAKMFAGLTPDQTFGVINSTQTILATKDGVNVVSVSNINLGNGEHLTLDANGHAGVQFVVNVSGGADPSHSIVLTGGNGEGIVLAGGLTPDDVVINVTSTSGGDNVTTSGGSSPDPNRPGNTLPNAVINGILLDVAGGIGMSPGMVNGEIIGGGNEIRLVSGSQVNGGGSPPTPVPEPSALWLLGLGALGLAGYSWRRRKLAAA